MNDKCVVVQCPVMSRRVVVGRSTKGASRQRRSLINGEILSLRQLLPVSDCTRQRLSQLQTMSLACIFIRKYQLLGASSSECLFIRTVRIVCGAGSMKRYGVRPSVRPFVCPSVCPSMGPQQQTPCCRFAAVDPVGSKYRLIAAAAAGECGQCHVVSVRRQLNTNLLDR